MAVAQASIAAPTAGKCAASMAADVISNFVPANFRKVKPSVFRKVKPTTGNLQKNNQDKI